MKKKYIFITIIILIFLIAIGLFINVNVRKKYIKSETLMEIELFGYVAEDVKDIKIDHSYMRKLLGYNEWRISVEFEKLPNIYFWFTYEKKQVISQGVSSITLLDKEEMISYSEKFKNGSLLNN